MEEKKKEKKKMAQALDTKTWNNYYSTIKEGLYIRNDGAR